MVLEISFALSGVSTSRSAVKIRLPSSSRWSVWIQVNPIWEILMCARSTSPVRNQVKLMCQIMLSAVFHWRQVECLDPSQSDLGNFDVCKIYKSSTQPSQANVSNHAECSVSLETGGVSGSKSIRFGKF